MRTLEGMTLADIEHLLDHHMIMVEVQLPGHKHPRLWRVRRNGATRLWKRGSREHPPGDWRIPVKAGLYLHGEINPRKLGDYRAGGLIDPDEPHT